MARMPRQRTGTGRSAECPIARARRIGGKGHRDEPSRRSPRGAPQRARPDLVAPRRLLSAPRGRPPVPGTCWVSRAVASRPPRPGGGRSLVGSPPRCRGRMGRRRGLRPAPRRIETRHRDGPLGAGRRLREYPSANCAESLGGSDRATASTLPSRRRQAHGTARTRAPGDDESHRVWRRPERRRAWVP